MAVAPWIVQPGEEEAEGRPHGSLWPPQKKAEGQAMIPSLLSSDRTKEYSMEL